MGSVEALDRMLESMDPEDRRKLGSKKVDAILEKARKWQRGDRLGSSDRKHSRVCDGCAMTEQNLPANKFLTCSGCELVFYCSRDCQKKAWRVHKHTCKQEGLLKNF